MKELANTDVLVVGGGPAGIGAAIGAARKGARTLLVETHAFFGGIGAFCVGMPINQVRPSGLPRSVIHELFLGKLFAYGDRAARMGEHQVWTNVEYLKVSVLDALEEVGVRYLVHTRAVDALVENGRVAGAVVATKNGLMEIHAAVTIDASGDADISFFAGAETMKEAGNLSPMTLCIDVTNVDVEKAREVRKSGALRDLAERARQKYPLIPERWSWGDYPVSTGFFINHSGTKTLGHFDGTDPWELTRAEAVSRRQAIQMVDAMREFGGAAFSSLELAQAGPQVGVRETRRVKGLYVLTEEDALAGRTFDDVIAWRSGYLDIGFVRFEKMKIHDVPYRALVPEKVDGLLVAGRCISATHVAASAGKSMGNCMATGHAAGLAAAMSVVKRISPRELDVRALQDALRADGVDLARGGAEQDIKHP